MQITTGKFETVLAALRRHALYTVTQPGMTGDKPIAAGCEECKREWKPGEPENHAPDCPCSPLSE